MLELQIAAANCVWNTITKFILPYITKVKKPNDLAYKKCAYLHKTCYKLWTCWHTACNVPHVSGHQPLATKKVVCSGLFVHFSMFKLGFSKLVKDLACDDAGSFCDILYKYDLYTYKFTLGHLWFAYICMYVNMACIYIHIS